jgi:integrase
MSQESRPTPKFEKTWELEVRIGLNDIATRCFRNTADHEYIMARMAYRANLLQQFNWSALHALEKYLKGICLYNRIKCKDRGHRLRTLRKRLEPLSFLELRPQTVEFMDRIEDFGGDRYLTRSWMSRSEDLPLLDRAVWDVRRFCRVLNPEFTREPAKSEERLASLREQLNQKGLEPHDEPPLRGRLEEILEQKNHPGREALVWMNHCCGPRRRRTVKIRGSVIPAFENSPAHLYPEIIEEAKKYVYWPS